MNRILPVRVLALALFTLVIAACEDDGDELTGVEPERLYAQVERLGNPLVSEVTFAKRDRCHHRQY